MSMMCALGVLATEADAQEANVTPPKWAAELLSKVDKSKGWHMYTQAPQENGTYHDNVWNRDVKVYEISKPEELAWAVFNNSSIAGKDVCLRLTKDIDLSAHPWVTFDWTHNTLQFLNNHRFTFIFDGQGHTISKLYTLDQYNIRDLQQEDGGEGNESFVGLFPVVSGKAMIKNLTLDSVYVYGPQGGALIGRAETLDRPFKGSGEAGDDFRFLQNIVVSNAVVAGYGKVELQKKEYKYDQPIGGVVGKLNLTGGDGYKDKKRKDCVLKNVNFYGEVVARRNRCSSVGGMIGDCLGNKGEPNDNTLIFEDCIVAVDFVTRAAWGESDCKEWMGGFIGYSFRCDGNHYTRCIVVNDNQAIKNKQSDIKYGVLVGRLENDNNYFHDLTYVPKSNHPWYGVNGKDHDPTEHGERKAILPDTDPTKPMTPKQALAGMYDSNGCYPLTQVPVKFKEGRLLCLDNGGSDAIKFTSKIEGIRNITISDDGYEYIHKLENSVEKDCDYKTSEYVLLPNVDNAKTIREKGYYYGGERMYRYLKDTLKCSVKDNKWDSIQAGGDQMVRLPKTTSAKGVEFNPKPTVVPVAKGVRGYTINLSREFVIYWANASGKPSATSDKCGWRVYRTMDGVQTCLTADSLLAFTKMEFHDKTLFDGKNNASTVQVTYTVVWIDEKHSITEDISYKCNQEFMLNVPKNEMQANQRETGEVDINLNMPCYDWYQDCKVTFYRGRVKVGKDVPEDKTKIETIEYTFTEEDKAAGQKTIQTVDKERKSICDGYVYWADIQIRDEVGAIHTATIDYVTFKPYLNDKLVYLKVSRGEFDDRVKLQWEMHYSSDKLRFTVQRRRVDPNKNDIGSNDDWEDRTTMIESKNVITYEDKVLPGHVYEYRLRISPVCDENPGIGCIEEALKNTQYGYANNMGTVAGRITYKSSSGTSDISAQQVDVFVATDDSEMSSFAMTHNAIRVNGNYTISTSIPKIAGKTFNQNGSKWTVQCHINPNIEAMNEGDTTVLYRLPNSMSLLMCKSDSLHVGLLLDFKGEQTDCGTTIDLKSPINFKHIVLRSDGNKVQAGYMEHRRQEDQTIESRLVWGNELQADKPITADSTLCLFGIPDTTRRMKCYVGEFDEFRVWSKALTDEQIESNYNRYLAGTEDGMELYYTFDEAIATVVFDHQHRGNDWSDNIGTVNNISGKDNTPAQLVLVKDYSPKTTENQTSLAAHGITNEQGEYLIVGIPYAGSGTQYSLTPVRGTHKFNPAVSRRVFSNDSRTYTGVNFTDESSFMVKVQAEYALGTLPAEGLQVMVDGHTQSDSKGILKTDADGMATVYVPIGKHRISLMSPNHTMLNPVDPQNPSEALPCLERTIIGGEAKVTPYPEDPIDVQSNITDPLRFYDNTYIRVVGRVVGGDREAERQFGYREYEGDSLALRSSRNNIGRANVVFRAIGGRYANKTVYYTGIVPDTTKTAMLKPDSIYRKNDFGINGNINSPTVYRDDRINQCVSVVTDTVTGEYIALLPPIKWEIDADQTALCFNPKLEDTPEGYIRSLKSELQAMGVGSTFSVDLSSGKMETDKIVIDNRANLDVIKSKYNADTTKVYTVDFPYHVKKNIVRYAKQPEVTIYDVDRMLIETKEAIERGEDPGYLTFKKAHMLGEDTVFVRTYERASDSTFVDKKNLIRFMNGNDKEGYAYKLGKPVFLQNSDYSIAIGLHETYRNYDTDAKQPIEDHVPLNNTEITVYNNWASRSVKMDKKWVEDKVKDMSAEEKQKFTYEHNDTLKFIGKMNEYGYAVMNFQAGYPKAMNPYTSTMQMSFQFHGTTVTWPEKQGMEGIVLGMAGIPGSSFVTGGPDRVDFVINDPPGSNSSAYIEKGSTITLGASNNATFGDVTSDESQWAIGAEVEILSGFAFITKTSQNKTAMGGAEKGSEFDLMSWSDRKSMTYSFNERIQTSSSPDFVGADGDIYVGRATNYFFTDTRYTNMSTENERTIPQIDKDIHGNGIKSEDYTEGGKTIKGGVTFYLTNWIQPIGGTTAKTLFSYTQKHILNVLMPDLRKRRAELLVYDEAMKDKKSDDLPPLPSGECKYYAKRPLDQMDNNKVAWMKDIDYIVQRTRKDTLDKVCVFSTGLEQWENAIKDNERNKAYNFYILKDNNKYKESTSINDIDFEGIAKEYKLSGLSSGILVADQLSIGVYALKNIVKIIPVISAGKLSPLAIAPQALATAFKALYNDMKKKSTEGVKLPVDLHYIGNKSFDAGSSVNNNVTITKNYTATKGFDDNTELQFGGVIIQKMSNLGPSVENTGKTLAGLKYGSSKNVEAAFAGTTSYGFTLATSGASTYESVDIYLPVSYTATIEEKGGVREVSGNGTMPYMFRLRGGQSKVPWEKPDSTIVLLQADTLKMENGTVGDPFPLSEGTVALAVPEFDMLSEFAKMPAGERSSFEVTLRNISAATFSPTVSEPAPKLCFGVDPKTNHNGLLFDYGTASGQYVVGLKPQTSTKLSVTVQQTRTDVTRDTVSFLFYPEGDQGRAVSKRVIFNFVPMASPVTLEIDRVMVNAEAAKEKKEIGVTLSGYHMEYKDFAGIVVQARRVGTNTWMPIHLFYIDKEKYNLEKDWEGANDPLIAGQTVTTLQLDDRFSDGEYEICAVAQSKASREATALEQSSRVLTFSIDTKQPAIMGKPTSVLLYGEDLRLTFDENILKERVTTENFNIVTDLDAQVAREHSVAMKFYKCGAAESNNQFDLFGYRDFTLALKFKPIDVNSETVLFSQAVKTGDFRISYNDARVCIQYGDSIRHSEKQVLDQAGNKYSDWMMLLVRYQRDDTSSPGTVSAELLTNTGETYRGPVLILGDCPQTQATLRLGADQGKSNGNTLLHDVMLWEGDVDKAYIDENLDNALRGLDNALIAYWPGNEGRGHVATDRRYGRNLRLPAGAEWYSRIPNYSLQLDGSHAFNIPTGEAGMSTRESYALSFWFKSADNQQDATLCAFNRQDGTRNTINIGNQGTVTATFADKDFPLGIAEPLVWHNFCLEYVSGGYSRFYIDGEVVKEVESNLIPQFNYTSLTMGAYYAPNEAGGEQTAAVANGFKGHIDDVRLQKGRFTQNILVEDMHHCLTGREEGLKIYYPFQHIMRLDDPVAAVQCDYNHIYINDTIKESDKGMIIGGGVLGDIIDKNDAPMQLSASFRRQLAGKSEYNVTASDREVVINITDDIIRRLNGKTLHITALNIQDTHANTMTPYSWDAVVHQEWGGWIPSLLEMTLPVDTIADVETGLVKYKPMGNLTLSGLEDWITPHNTTDDTYYYYTVYTISTKNLSPGIYYAQVSLTNSDGESLHQIVKLTVKGKDPGWRVDPKKYDSNMSLIADLYLNSSLWTSEDVKVAAFIDGECRGLGQIKHNVDNNRSLIYMTIYGNDMTGGDTGKQVTLKAWDPNTGIIYNPLLIRDYDNNDVKDFKYNSSKLNGEYDRPWHLIAYDVIQQDWSLSAGWNWVSTFVNPTNSQASELIRGVESHIGMVKDRLHAAMPRSKEMGNVYIMPGEMYMIHVKGDNPISRLSVCGVKANPDSIDVTIPGSTKGMAWGWIGYPCKRSMTLQQALVNLTPHKNDIIKSQTEFAVFDGHNWQGPLEYLNPGQGYMYGNNCTTGDAITFHFPSESSVASRSEVANKDLASADYPNNMVVIGETLPHGKICAFVDGEQRAEAVADADGRVYLTVGGEGTTGSLTFVIVDSEDNALQAAARLQYADNRVDGSLETPVVLLPADNDNGNDYVYDLSGRCMGKYADKSSFAPGVYVMRGLKFHKKR